MEDEDDILFLRELFDIDDIRIRRSLRSYEIYMVGSLVLLAEFKDNVLELYRPESPNVKKRVPIVDENISCIRKCVEELWIHTYAALAQQDLS